MNFNEAFKELQKGNKIHRTKKDSVHGYYVFMHYCGEPRCIGFHATMLGTFPAIFLEEDIEATDWEIVNEL